MATQTNNDQWYRQDDFSTSVAATEHGQSRGVALATRTEMTGGTNRLGEYSDGALVACLGKNKRDAHAELFRRHAASVTAVARKILLDKDRSEDVAADVFVGLWLFPEKFDPRRGTLLAFLRVKARGRSIDIIRSESDRRRREINERHTGIHHHSDADAGIVGAESAVAMRNALAHLSDLEREPIYLAYFGELTYKEVAKRLNLPEGTVKTRIRAGLSHLRDFLQLELLRDVEDLVTTDG